MQAVADGVDAALLRDLTALAGIESLVVSPLDYTEIELGVGCSEESRACLLAIAHAVRVDALVIRRLSVDGSGNGQLELTYFVASSNDAPTTVQATSAQGAPASDLADSVPSLVRRLFGIADDARPAAPAPLQTEIEQAPPDPALHRAPEHVRTERPGISAGTWIALGAGAAALVAGAAVGWTAKQDFADWKDTPVHDRDEADEARAAFSGIRDRTVAANVLVAVGAVGIGLGATLLVLDIDRAGEPVPGRTQLSVAPTRGGAVLHVRGTVRDAL